MRSATLKAASKHNIGFAFNDGLDDNWKFLGVIFKVGILDNADVTRCFSKACSKRGSLALIGFVENSTNFGII